jgi:beta-lactamase regulating signal transducer with metallopeptidase domain
LLTYLVHSTLLIAGMGLLAAALRPANPVVRQLFWKAALLGGVATSSIQTTLPTFPRGSQWTLGSVANMEVAMPDDVARPLMGPAPMQHSAATEHSISGGAPATLTFTATASGDAGASLRFVPAALVAFWLIVAGAALVRLAMHARALRRLERTSRLLNAGRESEILHRLAPTLGVRRVVLYASTSLTGPVACGLLRPRIFVPASFRDRLTGSEWEALLAHELAHLARRDPVWTLLVQIVCRTFFFQPLNFLLRRRIAIEAEYLADQRAAAVLADRAELAKCLTRLAHWFAGDEAVPAVRATAVAMVALRSELGRRVHRILHHETSPRWRDGPFFAVAATAALLAILLYLGPRAVARPPVDSSLSLGDSDMRLSTALPVVLAAALATAGETPADDITTPAPQISPVPEGMYGFRGLLLGELIQKDVEQGAVVLKVAQIKRIWRNNQAKGPQAAVGKTLRLDGISGRFLDELLSINPGDGIEIEARHTRGDTLQFLGEGLRKASREELAQAGKAAVDQPAAPRERERFAGFRGMVEGTVVAASEAEGRLTLRVVKVPQIWKESGVEDPKAVLGRTLALTVNPEAPRARFHPTIKTLKQGDLVRAGVYQAGEDRYLLVEELRKVDPSAWREDLRGFRGILVGKLVSKDVEKGTFSMEIAKIKRQWPQSKAKRAESAVGQQVKVEGVFGRFLDALLTLKDGELMEVEAVDQEGQSLRFPGEWLKKAEEE